MTPLARFAAMKRVSRHAHSRATAEGRAMDRSQGGHHPVEGPDLRQPKLTARG
jgi:hypothetical protein